MRFFEYESRQILEREGIPVAGGGFATDAEAAKAIAADVGGPVVIKSQVLTGGRTKAGGVKFADTPEQAQQHAAPTPQLETNTQLRRAGRGARRGAGGVKLADPRERAEQHAADILKLEINGHLPRGVLVDPKADVKQEYYAGVVWDGTIKKPVILFSDMGGIDIEEVAEQHPDHVGRVHISNLMPISDFKAKECIAQTGVTGKAPQRPPPTARRPAPPSAAARL